jgi:ABC transporter substrate binding protein
MRRREFITLLGGAAAWPLAVRAQQPPMPVIGFLGSLSQTAQSTWTAAFVERMREHGWIEGRMTETIPIVGLMADPVAYGLAASLGRPGGNITGISVDAGLDIWGKRLQVLQEAMPTVSKVGFLASRLSSNQLLVAQMGALRDAGRKLNISLVGPPLESPVDEGGYRRVFREMAQERVDGLIVSDYATHFVHRQLIVDLAEEARLPTVYPFREYFEVGGPDCLWVLNHGYLRSRCWLYRQDSQRRDCGRNAHLSGGNIRTVDKHEKGKGAHPYNSNVAPRARRRGD